MGEPEIRDEIIENPDHPFDAPGKDRAPIVPGDRDAGDIIEGDIGEARLKEPSDTPPGADLDKLRRVVDAQDEGSEGSAAGED